MRRHWKAPARFVLAMTRLGTHLGTVALSKRITKTISLKTITFALIACRGPPIFPARSTPAEGSAKRGSVHKKG